MRVLYISLFFVIGFSLSLQAQNFKIPYYDTIDLYNGFDYDFYSGSSFGVKNPIYSAYPVMNPLRHNRADGLVLGYQLDKMNWSKTSFMDIEQLNINGMLSYAMAQKKWQYSAGLEKGIGNDHTWLLLGGNFYRSTSTEDYWRTGLDENSITSFFTGFDYQDYYMTDGFGIYSLLRPASFLELGVSYNRNTYSSLEKMTDFSLFSRITHYRPNPGIDADFDIINQESLTLGATLKPGGYSENSAMHTVISFSAELADIGQVRNDFLYNQYRAEVKSYFSLDKATVLKWRVMAGGITGQAPDFKNFALGGIGSMRAFGYKSMVGNQMLLSNLEIEFGKKSNLHAG